MREIVGHPHAGRRSGLYPAFVDLECRGNRIHRGAGIRGCHATSREFLADPEAQLGLDSATMDPRRLHGRAACQNATREDEAEGANSRAERVPGLPRGESDFPAAERFTLIAPSVEHCELQPLAVVHR